MTSCSCQPIKCIEAIDTHQCQEIIVIEDNLKLLKSQTDFLNRKECHQKGFSSADDCIQYFENSTNLKCQKCSIIIIISDQFMPGLNGCQLIAKLTPLVNFKGKEIQSILVSADYVFEAEHLVQNQFYKPLEMNKFLNLKQEAELFQFLNFNELMKMLTNLEREKLTKNSKKIQFNHSDSIIKKNDTDTTVQMLKSGVAHAQMEDGTIVLTQEPGMIFGERAITENKTRSIDIVCWFDNVEVYAFDPQSFLSIYPSIISYFKKIQENQIKDEFEETSLDNSLEEPDFMKVTKVNDDKLFYRKPINFSKILISNLRKRSQALNALRTKLDKSQIKKDNDLKKIKFAKIHDELYNGVEKIQVKYYDNNNQKECLI